MASSFRLIPLLLVPLLPLVEAPAPASGSSELSAPAIAAADRPVYTPVERTLVDWALGRFAAAGLELPDDLVITFHRSVDACEGDQGRYYDTRPGRVLVCRTADDPRIELRLRRHALVHELAHAWNAARLPDEARDAFVTDRGASSWNDRSQPWYLRGTEQAAEILTWGLLDGPVGFLNIKDASCERLEHGFVMLTGRGPINPAATCDR